MSKSIAHLRAQWIGVLALLIALGTGSAYAANTVFSEDIVNGEVKAADIGNNAVRTGEIRDADVQGADLAFNAVGSSQIATNAVNATEVADGAIDSGEIFDESVGSADLAASSVGGSEVALNSIGSSDITSSGVGSDEVANNSLTSADIAGTDISGHVSIAANAVPLGHCEAYEISVPGAIRGQAVLLAVNGLLEEGMLLNANKVNLDGKVVMKVCNLAGPAMDAIVDLPIRVMTFG